MARNGDKGAYEIGNVKICTVSENHKEKRFSKQTIQKMKKRVTGSGNPMYGKFGVLNPFFGKKHTNETKRKLGGKLTLEQENEIRMSDYYHGSGRDLAKKYGVKQSKISYIRRDGCKRYRYKKKK